MNSQNDIADVFLLTLIIIGISVGCYFFYEYNMALCNSIAMGFNRAMLYPFSFVSGSNARKLIEQFNWNYPLSYNWDSMMALTAISGSYWRWVFLPFFLFMAYVSFTTKDVKSIYQRSLSMRALLQNNIQAFPCIAPVARRDILSLPMGNGPWAAARSPLQFSAENNIIIDHKGEVVPIKWLIESETKLSNDKSPLLARGGNKGIRLHKERTEELFVKQLGKPYVSVEALPDHIKGLAAAFMAFGCGDKDSGQKMLDHMSLSYEDDEKGNPKRLNINGAHELLSKYAHNTKMLQATSHHNSYICTWLSALLVFARTKGVLASSQFIWLRPVDRVMFYTLNQVGGRRPWAEAIGPWNHYVYEEEAKQAIHTPIMGSSVDDLAREIAELGYLDETLIAKTRH